MHPITKDILRMSFSLAVRNLDETAAWYREHFGFEVVQSRDFPEYGTRIVFLEGYGCRMELIEDKNWHPVDRPNPPQHTTVQGVSQIAFLVPDISKVVEEVKSRPIAIAWDLITVEDLGMKEFFIRDNEGNILQFIQNYRNPPQIK